MSFKTITAPHINANDVEMVLVEWHVRPWQKIVKGEPICDVESTKALLTVEADRAGYVYPLVEEKATVRVGEPLAHVFVKSDPEQLAAVEKKAARGGTIVTKKARILMQEFGLTASDFPEFTNISSETVVAKIRERKLAPATEGGAEAREVRLDDTSVVLYGDDPNFALLALDAFAAGGRYSPAAYVGAARGGEFYGIPALPSGALSGLMARGARRVFICGSDCAAQVRECEALGWEIVSAVHSSAVVAVTARLGRGVFVGAQAAIGPDAEIGDFCRILCGASVAHHGRLGKFVSVSDGARLGGHVSVGDGSLIGIGVNVNKRVAMGKGVVVVSGVTVTDHVPDKQVVRAAGQGKTDYQQRAKEE
ncbi:MAG: biotin/lipoyl-containing protein [Elusimicrobiota bacterium]